MDIQTFSSDDLPVIPYDIGCVIMNFCVEASINRIKNSISRYMIMSISPAKHNIKLIHWNKHKERSPYRMLESGFISEICSGIISSLLLVSKRYYEHMKTVDVWKWFYRKASKENFIKFINDLIKEKITKNTIPFRYVGSLGCAKTNKHWLLFKNYRNSTDPTEPPKTIEIINHINKWYYYTSSINYWEKITNEIEPHTYDEKYPPSLKLTDFFLVTFVDQKIGTLPRDIIPLFYGKRVQKAIRSIQMVQNGVWNFVRITPSLIRHLKTRYKIDESRNRISLSDEEIERENLRCLKKRYEEIEGMVKPLLLDMKERVDELENPNKKRKRKDTENEPSDRNKRRK